MNPFDDLSALVTAALGQLQAQGVLPEGQDLARVQVEPPRDAAHGDAATNAALILAKAAGAKPMDIAAALAVALEGAPEVDAAVAAAPGFVNLSMRRSFWLRRVPDILAAGALYGRSDQGGGQKVNVEFCSANPTGPLHVGHARGAVFGDALSSLLQHVGYEVTREYYINDGGAQIDTLARTIHHRYREALGMDVGPLPAGYYPLAELVPVAEAIARRDGDRWVMAPEEEWLEAFGQEAVQAMMRRIKGDLAALGIHHDVFSSERRLRSGGEVDAALARLDEQGLIYEGVLPAPKGKPIEDWEPTPQLLFRATAYGDDIDRPLKRSNGAWTYFAADLAYHFDKYERGFNAMIDVLGADHGGYVKRMQAGVRALSKEEARLDVMLCQLVKLMDGGQPLKMSKRAGRIVTLKDVVDEVGKDVFRFIMLTRKNDAALEFDLVKVKEQSKDNPVFYVQYAHARISSVFRNAAGEGIETGPPALMAADLDRLSDPLELALIRQAAGFPRIVTQAAEAREPHRIAFFLHELAGQFHALWTTGKERQELRFIVAEDAGLTAARLAMLAAVQTVLAAGLKLIGVEPVEEMH
ncbi:arginyl-tRNA synthetase [Arboricoccus pini]|uniref:Arginine--tRNA ligase n=1 Tax=Arboricoccus pini TaxID=1963835 RepID=A0A212QQG3_9PROT|nr:arginine--tRNA ligase [Arboricoccus pini]SNB61558.1 arginyl-tRNA synthetase [Arboricoccus pini]